MQRPSRYYTPHTTCQRQLPSHTRNANADTSAADRRPRTARGGERDSWRGAGAVRPGSARLEAEEEECTFQPTLKDLPRQS